MNNNHDFTEGEILRPMLTFRGPVLLAMFLQSLYGAVDLMVVGKFSEAADASGVNTGSQVMMMLTFVVTSFSMAVTILMGQHIGEKSPEKAGDVIGTGIIMFAVMAVAMTFAGVIFAPEIAAGLKAPRDAFNQTVSYIRVCSSGFVFIIAYNVMSGVFRGVGDSVMPLISVTIASVFNIIGDLFFVKGMGMGAKGAAIATVMAQVISVILSMFIISKRKMPFILTKDKLRIDKSIAKKIFSLGTPLLLQDILVSISFLFLLAITNSRGVIVSAGVGIAERLCGFIMLVPSAFSQSISAFVAQNVGAKRMDRANTALKYALVVSVCVGLVIAYVAYFHGDILCEIFSNNPEIIAAAWEYLKAYGIDTVICAFMFCFIGYFNGRGKTVFTMAQSVISSFCIRIPMALIVSRIPGSTVFQIGLSTPASSVLQMTMCLIYFIALKKKDIENGLNVRQ